MYPIVMIIVCFVLYLTALSDSDYIVLNEGVISGWWIGKDVKGSGHGLILSTIPAFAWKTEENHEKPQASRFPFRD
jgi:hypothetical protein